MTPEQFSQVKFRCVCSLSLDSEHILTFSSSNGRLGFCDHTTKKKNGDFSHSYRHWRIDGKVYKNRDKFFEALSDYNDEVNIVSIR